MIVNPGNNINTELRSKSLPEFDNNLSLIFQIQNINICLRIEETMNQLSPHVPE